MPDDEALTIEIMRVLATHADLVLTDDELREVMPGVKRNIERARTLQKWVTQDVELGTVPLVPGSEVSHVDR